MCLLVFVLGVFLAGCGGGGECAGREADACHAERARAAFATDPARGRAEALAITDPELRDLVLLEGVRSSGHDLCELVTDPRGREHCRQTMNRPHLGQPEPSGPAAPLSEEARAARRACEGSGQPVEGCLERAARQAPDPEAAAGLCRAIGQADRIGECLVARAQDELEARGDLAAGVGLCEGATGRWAGECRFRLAETLEAGRSAEALALCGQAGTFDSQCATHVVERAAREAVVVQPAGTPGAAAVAALAQRAEELVAQAPPGLVAAEDLRHLFWLAALQQLLARVSSAGELERWRGLPAAIEDPDAALVASEVLPVTWIAVAIQRALQGGEVPGLQALADEARLALDPAGAPPLAELRLPVALGRQSASSRLLSNLGPGTAIQHALPLLGAPVALDPRSPCPMDPATRELVLALWAVQLFPPSKVQAALVEGLRHEQPVVRASALGALLETLAVARNREAALPTWVSAELERLAADPGSPALARLARELPADLGRGLDSTAMQPAFDELCGRGSLGPPPSSPEGP